MLLSWKLCLMYCECLLILHSLAMTVNSILTYWITISSFPQLNYLMMHPLQLDFCYSMNSVDCDHQYTEMC